MKAGALIAIAAIAGLALVASSSKGKPLGAPSIKGLTSGASYRVIARSSLASTTFVNAVLEQAQTLLGRQAFNVVATSPNANGDPYVYDVWGTYQGTAGGMSDDPQGLALLGFEEVPASSLPAPPLEYVTSRPVALVPGTTYAGRASLSWPITLFISPSDVVAKLRQQGFTDVIAYTHPDDLPSDWAASERGGDVFAIATYPLTASEKTMEVPSQVRAIWKVAAA